MHADRTLAPSPFPGDAGEASAQTRAALAAAHGGGAGPGSDPTAYLTAVAALCLDRLLVPVVATATRLTERTDGLVSDKEAEMSVVGLTDRDGRRAMLAFTGLDALTAWDARARPVPVTLDLAAQSALADGAVALLIDVAGPSPAVIDGEILAQLAQGHRLVALAEGEFGWAVPASDG